MNTNENFFKGIIGALIGSIIGGLVIFLFARFGRISSIGTLVFGIAVVFCYKKFAGDFSIIGAIICTIFSILVTYLVCNLDIALDVHSLLEGTYLENISFWECFTSIKDILEEANSMDTYYRNLVLMEVFSIFGTVGTSYALLKKD